MKIALGIAGFAGVGKTTTAEMLQKIAAHHGVRVQLVPFAAPVKRIAIQEFGWDGVKDERGRRLLKCIGTDAGRVYDENIWVRKWTEVVKAEFATVDGVIADDVRFANEAEAIRALGGRVVRLVSQERGQRGEHASEQQEFDVDLVYNIAMNEPPMNVAAAVFAWIRKIAAGFTG